MFATLILCEQAPATCLVLSGEPAEMDKLTPTPFLNNVSDASAFQLPTNVVSGNWALRKPSSRSDNREKPRHMTVVPGGGSLFRSRYPPRRAMAVI